MSLRVFHSAPLPWASGTQVPRAGSLQAQGWLLASGVGQARAAPQRQSGKGKPVLRVTSGGYSTGEACCRSRAWELGGPEFKSCL